MADKVSKFIFPVKTGNTIADKEFDLPSGGNTYVDELPYEFFVGSAVVFNDEIHILGSVNQPGDGNYHYKWDGISWTEVSTLPHAFFGGSAVVFNKEIHILGGTGGKTKHYKWDGSSWIKASTLPHAFFGGSAVVFNKEIHILGGTGNRTAHYKWNGTSWTEVSTLPYECYIGSAVVYNNEIHILGGSFLPEDHYKWNGSSWVSVSTLPYNFYEGSAVVYNNEIYILGGQNNANKHYKWNGTSWTEVSTLPYDFYDGATVIFNNEIHILGGANGQRGNKNHYRWTGTEWTNIFDKYALINHNHDDRYYTKSEIDAGGGNTFVGTTAEWNALTVEQQNAYDCRVLTDDDLDTKSVIDNLTSDSSTDALSAKQGKVLKGLIDATQAQVSNSGDAYDPTRPYKVKELCIYNNVLYRCIIACSAGSWETNQSCFTPDTLVNTLNNVGAAFKEAGICSDANNPPAGLSYLSTGGTVNSPFHFWGSLLTIYGNPDEYKQQIAFPWDPNVNVLYYRSGVGSTWGAWKPIGYINPSTTEMVSNLSSNGDGKAATLVHWDKSAAKPFIYIDGNKVYLQKI